MQGMDVSEAAPRRRCSKPRYSGQIRVWRPGGGWRPAAEAPSHSRAAQQPLHFVLRFCLRVDGSRDKARLAPTRQA